MSWSYEEWDLLTYSIRCNGLTAWKKHALFLSQTSSRQFPQLPSSRKRFLDDGGDVRIEREGEAASDTGAHATVPGFPFYNSRKGIGSDGQQQPTSALTSLLFVRTPGEIRSFVLSTMLCSTVAVCLQGAPHPDLAFSSSSAGELVESNNNNKNVDRNQKQKSSRQEVSRQSFPVPGATNCNKSIVKKTIVPSAEKTEISNDAYFPKSTEFTFANATEALNGEEEEEEEEERDLPVIKTSKNPTVGTLTGTGTTTSTTLSPLSATVPVSSVAKIITGRTKATVLDVAGKRHHLVTAISASNINLTTTTTGKGNGSFYAPNDDNDVCVSGSSNPEENGMLAYPDEARDFEAIFAQRCFLTSWEENYLARWVSASKSTDKNSHGGYPLEVRNWLTARHWLARHLLTAVHWRWQVAPFHNLVNQWYQQQQSSTGNSMLMPLVQGSNSYARPSAAASTMKSHEEMHTDAPARGVVTPVAGAAVKEQNPTGGSLSPSYRYLPVPSNSSLGAPIPATGDSEPKEPIWQLLHSVVEIMVGAQKGKEEIVLALMSIRENFTRDARYSVMKDVDDDELSHEEKGGPGEKVTECKKRIEERPEQPLDRILFDTLPLLFVPRIS